MTDIEKLALRISERKTSCKKCVYESGPICLYPHTDAYIIDNNINPCFEGVYKYLMEQERKKLKGAFFIIGNEEAKCGLCGENVNLGSGSAPFDVNYCPHCGAAFSYGAVYCKNTKDYLRKRGENNERRMYKKTQIFSNGHIQGHRKLCRYL